MRACSTPPPVWMQPARLLTDGDRIADFGPRLFNDGVPEGIEIVDARGLCLAPGLIDMHVHFREPGHEHKETLASGSRAAAAGGVTTVACMANTDPVIDDIALVDFIRRRARETAIVNIHPVAAVTKGLMGEQMTEMGLLAEAGAVYFSDDGLPVVDSQLMRRALSYASAFGLMIAQHAEDPRLTGCGCMNEGETATRLGLPGIPNASEVVIVERDIRLVEITGGRYHVSHISTAEAVDAVRRAKARGLPVTAEAAPHHFTLDETAVGEYRTFAKMAPPLRASSDVEAVREGLRDGTIDAIATDHAPHDQDSKRVPFAHAAQWHRRAGNHAAAVAGNGRAQRHVPARRAAHDDHRPGGADEAAGGRLAKGAPADLVLFDPDLTWTVDGTALHSKSKNTPFDGRRVKGRAVRTVVGGRSVYTLT